MNISCTVARVHSRAGFGAGIIHGACMCVWLVPDARHAFGDEATAWRTMPDLGRWVREGNRGKKEEREGHEKTEKRRRGGREEGRKERRGEESARREARLWR